MEFKVRTRKLKYSSQSINGSARNLGLAEGRISDVINGLDIGSSTGSVRKTLRKSREQLSFLKAAASTASRNLNLIAQEYQRTEASISNQRKSKQNISLMERLQEIFDDIKDGISDVFHTGVNWYNQYVGDPVNLDNGNFIYEKNDLVIDGAEEFCFTRRYNSKSRETGAFGAGWVHNYELRLDIGADKATLLREDGSRMAFRREGDGFSLVSGGTAVLTKENEGFRLTTDLSSYFFDAAGAFIRFENEAGSGYSLKYGQDGLSGIVKDSGEWFELSYNDRALIETVTDHTGRTVRYTYKGAELLTVICGEQVTAYEYNMAGKISNIISPTGVRLIHNEYDASGRVTSQRFPDGGEMRYSYDDENSATVLREKNGNETYHYHDSLSRNTENVYSDGIESYEYNADNQIVSECDRNGNETSYKYDNRGNVTKIVLASGTVINITYEKHNKPASISVNGERRQQNIYDDRGNLIETVDALGRRTSTKYNDGGYPVEIRTPGGNTTELTYDSRNNIVSIVDEHGVRYRYEYDDLNRVISAVKGSNNSFSFRYDSYGNLTGITDAAGNTRSYKYNRINKLTELVDFDGARTAIEYNNLGFPCRITDPCGHAAEFEYDSMWNAAVEKLPNGGVRRAEYNENNRLVRETDPLGNETAYEYDGNGNMTARIDAEGAVTEYRYGTANELILIRDPEGNETQYEYDGEGNLVCIKKPNGGEFRLGYDAAGQLIKETDPLGHTKEYAYSADGDITCVTDEAGRRTVTEYSSKGKPSRVIYPDGREERFTYDENGNMSSRSNAQGFTMSYTYDGMDRLIEAKGSSGEYFCYTYDELGRLTSASDGKGSVSSYEYTRTGQLSSVTDELGSRTEYEYDELDMLIGISRIGEGNVRRTEYVRDLCGNVIKTVDPLGYTEEFAYNGRGELISKLDKDAYLTEYGYDLNGRLSSIRYNDGREVMMSYDVLGKLAEVMDWTGATKAESDILGRITKVTYPDDRTVEYTYGNAGERTSIRYPDGRTVNYAYDEALRLSSLKDGETDIRYEYDSFGQLVGKSFAGGLAAEYAYDNKGQLTELTSTYSGKLLDKVRLGYDAEGNRISAYREREGLPEESGLFEYGYDVAGRLSDVSRNGKLLRHYVYDSFGNRTSLETAEGSIGYSYDDMDRLLEVSGAVRESFRYDKRGNVIERLTGASETHSYVYGAMNRLESAAGPEGVVSYEYNGLGHRIADRIGNGPEAERSITYTLDLTKYYNNLLERNDNGDADSYIWDGIVVAARGRHDFDYVCDDMGSPSRLIGMDGCSAAVYGYDEFGVSLHDDYSLQPFGYTGYRVDPIADMSFAQAREYMPEHGRFAEQDPLKGNTVNPVTLNPYVYCGDMPYIYYDPNGMWIHLVIGAVVGGIVSGGVELGTQLVTQVVTGQEVHIDWGKVGAHAAGGATEGLVMAATGNPVAAAAAGGFVEGFTDSYFVEGKSLESALIAGTVDGAAGAAFAGLGKLAKKVQPEWFEKLTTSKYHEFFDDQIEGLRGIWSKQAWSLKGLLPEVPHLLAVGIMGGFSHEMRKFLKPTKWLKKLTKGFLKCDLGVA